MMPFSEGAAPDGYGCAALVLSGRRSRRDERRVRSTTGRCLALPGVPLRTAAGQVRERESSIELEIIPILDMYQMLERYLPGGVVDKVRETRTH